MLSFLDRERSIAKPGYSRWLVPPAALAIHLAIGQVYAFSVFKNPLLALKAADGSGWNLKEVGYISPLPLRCWAFRGFILANGWSLQGRARQCFVAATCFGLGFQVAAWGAVTHSLTLIYLGMASLVEWVSVSDIFSPVSTLIKWFPDRPGLATGLAIMGFGGGAMIGSPLGTKLMTFYKTSSHQPIAAAWVTMGILYFLFMMYGSLPYACLSRVGSLRDGFPRSTIPH